MSLPGKEIRHDRKGIHARRQYLNLQSGQRAAPQGLSGISLPVGRRRMAYAGYDSVTGDGHAAHAKAP